MKREFMQFPWQSAFVFSALLAFLTAPQQAQAQACGNLLSVGPVIFPVSGSKVVIGQTIIIERFSLSSAGGNCLFSNGVAFYAHPDGSVFQTMANLDLAPGNTISCPGPTGSGNVNCMPFPTNYVVNVADLNRTLSIVMPPRGQFQGDTALLGGNPNQVRFFGSGNVDGFDPNNPGNPTGSGFGSSFQFLIVVNPGIRITKECVNPCTPYGAPILFQGTISNTGDVDLVNIAVIDVPPVTNLSLAATTSLGNPFSSVGLNNRLRPGESVGYGGSYAPSGSGAALCGPFTDTITVTAYADQVFQSPQVTNQASAACDVCNNPGIAVSKQCPAVLILPSGTLTFTSTVTNTGNVPLTNVVVFNNQPAPGTLVFGPTNLEIGGSLTFTNSYIVPPDSCGPYADTLRVEAAGICGGSVSNSASASCPGTNNPSIEVVKACPPGPIQPGELLTVTGAVTNTGDITLTNVVVTNTIAALGNLTRRVLGPIDLAPGTGTNFSDSYIIPLDSCGPYLDTFAASGADKCFGRVVLDNASVACAYTNGPSIDVTKACPPGLIQPGELLTVTGTVTNTGTITLTNVVVTNTVAALGNLSRRVLGPINLAPGTGTNFSDSYIIPLDSCGPYADTFAANGADKCFGRVVMDSDTEACAYTNSPSIDVTKACPPGLIQPGQLLTVTGTVTNTGNITLTNVVVTNTIAALGNMSRRVLGPINLAPGAGTNFSDSYIIPVDSCGPYLDTFAASGADKCFGRVVTDSASVACAYTNRPSIDITKACPPVLIQPGQLLTVIGTVTNTGNITMTNVVVTNTIAALGNLSRRVLGPIILSPGAGTNFSDSYIIPLDSCGPYLDTFAASGDDKCFARMVVDSAAQACPGTNSPRINLIKFCPPVSVAPGQFTTISGVVSNAGNITLTNVLVFDNQPTNNTPLLGPIVLAPGQSATFTNSYRIPPNCCTYVDTVTTGGRDKCFGRLVTASATAACPTATDPRISVTKSCPPLPVPLGERLVFSGIVSNAGNITLTNVTVVNNQPSNNTPVFGPITLAPGETANYSGSYVVPTDICDTNILETVTARGHNLCNGALVTASQSALCPIVPTPRLVVTKNCPPNLVPPGGLLVFSGIVSNAGNITLTNVIVVNDHPTNNTPVLGPVTLTPKQSINFSGSYQVCLECCPPFVDTLIASGAQSCNGSNVTATATAYCLGITTPQLSVIVGCPFEPIFLGELYYSGTVSNAGDVTLGNIVVTDNKAGVVAEIIALAPGETEDFYSFFTPTNCGPNVSTLVTTRAFDVCTGGYLTNTTSATCTINCPPNQQPPILLGPAITNGQFTFSFATDQNQGYAVQYTPSLSPENWLTLTNISGNGATVIIHDTKTNDARFYRVKVE